MTRIALGCDNHFGLESSLSAHFGRCPYYIFVDASEEHMVGFQVVENPHCENHKPGGVPHFIRSQKANVIIAGGMGPRAVDLFNQFGIEVVGGAQGKVGDVLESYLRGEVQGVNSCEYSSHRCEE